MPERVCVFVPAVSFEIASYPGIETRKKERDILYSLFRAGLFWAVAIINKLKFIRLQ